MWRSQDGGTTWSQVFHTMNQNDFSDPNNPVGDLFGDRTEFDLVDTGTHTRVYLGDASDDFVLDGDPTTPLPQVWRVEDIDTKTASSLVGTGDNAGWTQLTSDTNGDNGFLAYGFCQNGQCGYDEFVASPPGHPEALWLGGSMNYDELPAYNTDPDTGQPPRSNGRAVIRSTNADDATAANVTWQDMTAVQGSSSIAWDPTAGIHPDLHAIAFASGGDIAFIGSDGGVVRVNVASPVDRSGQCTHRTYDYTHAGNTPTALQAADLTDCQRLLSAIPSAITPLNDGLNDLQFQSLSINPGNPMGSAYGGTQDNGTWSFTGTPTWLETVGGDGGQSGFNVGNPTIRYHNYFDATPEVNYHGDDPTTWLNTYDVLQDSGENQSFYSPFIADPKVAGRVFTGLQHVWRSNDNGGSEASLQADCNALYLNPDRDLCGDWQPLGADLTARAFGTTRAGGFVVADERALGDSGTMWAATNTGRVFVSKNVDDDPESVVFRRIDTPSTPGRFVSGIAVDPTNPNHAWVSFSGYSAYTPSTPGHVFEVTYDPATHSATWGNKTFDLGDQPVTGIAVNDQTGDLYAGTDFGVARLPAGSISWTDAGTGLPHVAVYGLAISPTAHVLYAATHGRGAYRLQLPSRPTGSLTGPDALKVGQSATYSATGTSWDGSPVGFAWTLPGTPGSASGASATFVPTKPGPATVSVAITDGNGLTTTLTKNVTVAPSAVPDKTKPKVKLSKVKKVHLPKKAVIRGQITDASGISIVTIRFGDGKRARVKLGRGGRFTVKHRYRLNRKHRHGQTFTVTITAVDKAGNKTTKRLHVRVLPR